MNSLRTVIDDFGTKYSDLTAIQVVDNNKSLSKKTYSEFYHDIKCVAAYYTKNNLVGNHVAIWAKNSYEWLVYEYAGFYAGVEMVFIHNDLPEQKAYENIKRADVKLVITDKKISWDVPALDIRGFLPAENADCEFADIDPARPCCLLFTSGTTAVEKMVELSQNNLLFFVDAWSAAYKRDKPITCFSVFPFSHTGSFVLMVHFFVGNAVTYQSNPKYFFRDVKIVEPNTLMCVPTYMEAMIKKIENGANIRDIIGNNCYQIGAGGAVIRPEIVKILNENHIMCSNGYGQTESGGCGAVYITGICDKVGSVGKPNIEMRIEDDEILIRGKSVMLGYYKDDEATKAALKDGWLHTGDLGYIDEDGYLFITGRKKNLIVLSNGKKVSPEEIENAIMKCNSIKEVVVTGEDELLVATVFCESGSDEIVKKYIREYNKNSESYKRIQRVEFRESEFEKTVTGKIKRW